MSSHPIVNVDQAAGWNGEEGDFWVEHEERFNASLLRHTPHLFKAAHISAGERVVDIGCGCGESTREAARAAAPGAVFGVDISNRMIERARERARVDGLTNVRFEMADAQVHAFEKEAFNVVISRFGVMFFSDPTAAFRNIGSSLRRGGRLALLAWRGLPYNEWIREFRSTLAAGRSLPTPPPGAPGPLGFASTDTTGRVLSDAGFDHVAFAEINEPMWFGKDRDDAFRFVHGLPMTRDMLSDLDPARQERTLGELRAMLARHENAEGVRFQSSAWIITAQRR